MLLPADARPPPAASPPHLTPPTDTRPVVLIAAAILTAGRRTTASLPRTVGDPAPGRDAGYRRVPPAAGWPGPELGRALARFLPDRLAPDGPVHLVGDDTVGGHPGPTVYGNGRHRDAVRSSHAYTARRDGHERVVPAVPVKLPSAARGWAPPALVGRCRTPGVSQAEGVRRRAPARLMGRPPRLVLIRLPGRAFVFAGGSGLGAHEVARFCRRHGRRLTPASEPHPDANRFAPPPPYRGSGRPRAEGDRVPKPRAAAAAGRRRELAVAWCGGRARRVEAVTGAGRWHEGGNGLAPIRWVYAEGAAGTHRDGYLLTTDTARATDAWSEHTAAAGRSGRPFGKVISKVLGRQVDCPHDPRRV